MSLKKVFIACPIGSDDSPERARSDDLLKYVIHPVVKELLGVPPEQATVRADKMGEPGRITTQVLRELIEADVVIADLTGTNPNVMYEVGIRQATVKPFVLMAEKGQRLPFDLNDLRTVFYQLDLKHFESAQTELKLHLEKALAGTVPQLDQALFARPLAEGQSPNGMEVSRDFLAVLEVCQGILKETQETKELVGVVGNIALQLRETREDQEKLRKEEANQQMGLMLMQQFFQNPEGAERLVPAMQKLMEFAEAQKPRTEEQKSGRKRR
jgi:nucleoside 2-deoxyribosyltransferase